MQCYLSSHGVIVCVEARVLLCAFVWIHSHIAPEVGPILGFLCYSLLLL